MRYKIFIAETGEPLARTDGIREAVRIAEMGEEQGHGSMAIMDTETGRVL